MKRIIDIIRQDSAIWELSPLEVENIFCVGVNSKILEKNSLILSEDDLIDAWVSGFKSCMPRFTDCDISLYKGIDLKANYTWMREHPNSWISN